MSDHQNYAALDGAQLRRWEQNEDQRSPYHPVCLFFTHQRWHYIERFIPLSEVKTVLDVGCGQGMASVYFDDGKHSLAGIDFSLPQLMANPLERLQKAVSTGEDLPFKDNSFDLVTCWEVLHHVADVHRVVTQMARLSKNWLVIFEPNILNPAQFLFSALIRTESKSLTLHNHFISDALRESGCDIMHFTRAGWILPNKMPIWALAVLRHLPYRFRVLGISRLWIAHKTLSR